MRNNYSKFLSAILGPESVVSSNNNVVVTPILEKEMDSFNDMCIFNKSKKRANTASKIYPEQMVDLMVNMGIDKHF